MGSKLAQRFANGQTTSRLASDDLDPTTLHTTIRKRIIICCDGTWFSSDKGAKNLPSNVARIGRLIATEGELVTNISGKNAEIVKVPQIVYYQSGVGTGDLTWVDKRIQGAFGENLDENICSAYNFLCLNYATGDEIFLFGFSRGAYTARALSGLILAAGILPPGSLNEFYHMYQAYKGRIVGQKFQDTVWWTENATKLQIKYNKVNIKFLGVWDTVGALGLPDSIMSRAMGNKKGYEFHDTLLSGKIQRAAQALALDEYRGTFSPTMWFQGEEHLASDLIQCWFPGYHAHIGGGTVSEYDDESSIDDITLAWMVDQTKDFLTYDETEINRFVAKQKEASSHEWAEGMLTDSASYAFLAPGAGGWKVRTPQEYFDIGQEGAAVKRPAAKGKTAKQVYQTREFVHPSVRYRMRLMEQKPKQLGQVSGWMGGKYDVEKYEPCALKGFVATLADETSPAWTWRKPAIGGHEGVVIREYRIAPNWPGSWTNEGLERQIVPDKVMAELDLANNYVKVPA